MGGGGWLLTSFFSIIYILGLVCYKHTIHEAERYRGHSCQLSIFIRDYPDIGSVISIFWSIIPNLCALSTCRALNNYTCRCHMLIRPSKFQFRQATDEDTMAAPHPKKPKVASK